MSNQPVEPKKADKAKTGKGSKLVVREHSTHLGLEPMGIRTSFSSRATYQATAQSMFQ